MSGAKPMPKSVEKLARWREIREFGERAKELAEREKITLIEAYARVSEEEKR